MPIIKSSTKIDSQTPAQLPSQKFRVINIADSPRYSSNEFDIVDELLSNRDHYLASPGDPTLSIMSFPLACSMNVERLRERVKEESKSDRKPGLHATISACIYYGCNYLLENEHVSSLLAAKSKLNLISEQVEQSQAEIINGMFSQYTMISNLPKGRRKNIFIPSHIHSPLSALSSDLSGDDTIVHLQSLSVIAVMHTLSLQPDTLEDHSKMMTDTVERFLHSVSVLNRAVKAIMREFKL